MAANVMTFTDTCYARRIMQIDISVLEEFLEKVEDMQLALRPNALDVPDCNPLSHGDDSCPAFTTPHRRIFAARTNTPLARMLASLEHNVIDNQEVTLRDEGDLLRLRRSRTPKWEAP